MSRPFDFLASTRRRAHFRQHGLCAVCGENLEDLFDNAHHVIPNQSGTAGHAQHAWLREVDNCVVLCDACHDAVHDSGRFRNGATAPPSYFEFSHAGNKQLHEGWAAELSAREFLLTKSRAGS